MSESGRLLKPSEVSEWLAVSKSTLVRWRRSGQGPRCLWLAQGCPRYRTADIEKWLEGRSG